MRIGMILDKEYPPDPRVENEAIELIKEGHDVYLFCLTYGNEKQEEVVQGIQVRRYKTNTLEYKLSALAYTVPFYSLLMKSKIKDFVEKNKVETIHIHDMQIAEAVFKANVITKLPTVLDLHENRPEIMRFYPHLQKTYGKLLISINKWIKKEEDFVKKATRVVVVTEHAKEELINRVGVTGNKIFAVPNTIRSSFYEGKAKSISYKKEDDDFTILYLGDTGTRRGLKTVVLSLLKLREEKNITTIKFVVVGKPSSYLEELVIKHGLENQVKLMGWQIDTTFPEWIRISDLCVSPLHRNIHHDTTYANKIFQYMSLGKALLVSDATAQEDVVKNNNAGLIHKAKDINDFTDKLWELYSNKELRETLGNRGKEFVRSRFTWDKTSGQLVELYKNLG